MPPNNSPPTVVFYTNSQFSNTELVQLLFNQKMAPSHTTGISFYHWIIDTSDLCAWFLIDEPQEKNVYLNEATVIVYCIQLSSSIDKKATEQELADLLTKSATLILLGINQNEFKISFPVKGQALNVSEMKSISCEAFSKKILSLCRDQKDKTKSVNDLINLPKSSSLYRPVNALLEISKTLSLAQTKAIHAETEHLVALLKNPEITDKISVINIFSSHCEEYVKTHSTLRQALLFIAFVGTVTVLAGTIGSGVGLIVGGMLLTKAATLLTGVAGLFSGITLGSTLFYPRPRNEKVFRAVNAVRKDALDCLSKDYPVTGR